MVVAIAWNLGGLVVMYFFMSSMSASLPPHQADSADTVDMMFKAMMAFNAVVALGFAWLFGWIAMRLMSEPIRREFAAPR
jgi:hypothetical protein